MLSDHPTALPISAIPKDRQLWLVLAGTIVVALLLRYLLPTGFSREMAASGISLLSFLLFYPLVEEVLFRYLIQGELLRYGFWRRRRLGVSRANLLTSSLFVMAHTIHQPLIAALSVMIPSLVLGYFRERYGRLSPSVGLHMGFNLAYLWAGLSAS